MAAKDKVPTDAELAGTADKEPDPPVYDERGNVRPRGTEGARPMSYAERVEIAKKLGAGEKGTHVLRTPGGDEPPVKRAAAKRTAKKK